MVHGKKERKKERKKENNNNNNNNKKQSKNYNTILKEFNMRFCDDSLKR
jgi:hypothetical protein